MHEVLRQQVRLEKDLRADARLEQVADAAARACVMAGATSPDDIARAVAFALSGPRAISTPDGRTAVGGFYAR